MLEELSEKLYVSLGSEGEDRVRKKNLDAHAVAQILRGETNEWADWYLDICRRPIGLAVYATSFRVALIGRAYGIVGADGARNLAFAVDDADDDFHPDTNWKRLSVSLGRVLSGSRLYKPANDWLAEVVDLMQRVASTPLVTATRMFVQHQLAWQSKQAEDARRNYQVAADGWVCTRCRELQPGGSSKCRLCNRPLHTYGIEVLLDRAVRLGDQAEVLLIDRNGNERQGTVVKGEGLRRRWLIRLKDFGHVSAGTISPRPNTAVLDVQAQIFDELTQVDLRYLPIARLLIEPASIDAPIVRQFGNPDRTLNTSQREAVMGAMNLAPGGILLVQGPPGTGKTTSIVEAVDQILEEVDPQARILMTSHSNTAVDSAQEKLAGIEDLNVVRVADPDKVDEKFQATVVRKCHDKRVYEADVVLGTVNRLALCDWDDDLFDWLILDEANKVRISEMLPILRLARRWLLIGDHQQLPPVVDESVAGFNGAPVNARIREASFFEMLWDPLSSNKRLMLNEQYRMAQPIGAFVSEAFYQGLLHSAANTEKVRSPLPWPFNKNLTWLTLRGIERRGDSGSLSNQAEINAVVRVVRALQKHRNEGLRVAVIAMYQDQVAGLRSELDKLNFAWLEVDTVDAFEGEEADVVILSLVRSNEAERIGFLDKAQRLNVAISRAKRLLIVVGDVETITGREGQELYRPLLDHIEKNGRVAGIGALRTMEKGHRYERIKRPRVKPRRGDGNGRRQPTR